jgi:hypothetical protein
MVRRKWKISIGLLIRSVLQVYLLKTEEIAVLKADGTFEH